MWAAASLGSLQSQAQLRTFSVGLFPRFALVILLPSLGSTQASRRAEYSLLYSSTCLLTALRHPSAASFLVSSWSPQMPTAIPVSFTQTIWFSCLNHKSICRQASMHVTLEAFAGASLLVWAPTKSAAWSSVPPGAAQIAMFLFLASCSLLTEAGALMSRMSPVVVTDCFINPARGAMFKLCPPVSLSPCLTCMFSRMLVLDWSSWAMMLQLLPSLIWCRQLLGWPRASPIAAIHWEVGIGDSLRLVFG